MRTPHVIAATVAIACACAPATDAPPSPVTTGDPVAAHSGTYVFRVDSTWERNAGVATPGDPLDEQEYRAHAARDAYTISIDGDAVTIVPLDGARGTVRGVRAAHAPPGEAHFDLDAFAGGRFVVRGARAELTIYGSGVPVVSSERGSLVRR